MKKFENRIIVTDLDGTLLNDKERVSERNRKAIDHFKANGGLFTIATGRVAQHVWGAIPDVDELVNFPAVTCNGACLYDFRTGESPVLHVMGFEDVKRLVGFIRENYPDAGIRASSPNYCFVTTPDDTKNVYIMDDLERYRGQSNLTAPIEEWEREPVMKVVIRMDSHLICGAMEAITREFGEKYSVTRSWSTIIDVQLGGVNKGVTLKNYIAEKMGEGVTLYACGDYLNDLEMLGVADVAVCPSGAHDAIKEASHLCLCSNNDGLIADLVEHIEMEIMRSSEK